MKIKVKDIEKKGSDHLTYNENPTFLNSDEISMETLDPVKVDVHLNPTRNGVYAAGEVQTTLSLSCSRCLMAFPHQIREEFHLEYRSRPTEFPEEIELDEESVGIIFFDGPEIDLSDQVRQDVLLAIPMKPVCTESCMGLCSICGGNLNEVGCDCSPADTLNPFAKLKSLKIS